MLKAPPVLAGGARLVINCSREDGPLQQDQHYQCYNALARSLLATRD